MKVRAGLKRLQTPIDLTKMSKAEARVEIAKDVLAALDAKKLEAAHGYYVRTTSRLLAGKELRDQMPKLGHCQTCALGSLFMAKVARLDNYVVPTSALSEWSTYDRSSNVYLSGLDGRIGDSLKDYFKPKQLSKIELAFDLCNSTGTDLSQDEYTAVERFRRFYDHAIRHADSLLRAIMQNIIDNHGTFIP